MGCNKTGLLPEVKLRTFGESGEVSETAENDIADGCGKHLGYAPQVGGTGTRTKDIRAAGTKTTSSYENANCLNRRLQKMAYTRGLLAMNSGFANL